MIIVTGAAGFIGSCIVSYLNSVGISDILCVDDFGSENKWKNLLNKEYIDFVRCDEFYSNLDRYYKVEIVIHMGACSSTTEKDMDYLFENNYMRTRKLYNWCLERNSRFIYASSAATYGNETKIVYDKSSKLTPLNKYAFSKYLFDQWQRKQKQLKQCVGLKFFNVYGPNEYHKNDMASLIFKFYYEAIEKKEITIFGEDGLQKRDFIYIKDLLSVIHFFMNNGNISGIFDVGTGKIESFISIADIIFKALHMEKKIVFRAFPESLLEIYQFYTCADISNLRKCGYDNEFISIKEGIIDYISYLENNSYY